MSKFQYLYPSMELSVVASNIDEYIIPENQEACKLLWSKNIYTTMTNNYDNNYSWINFSSLSDINCKILWEFSKVDKRFGFVGNGKGIRVNVVPGVGNDTYQFFKELIDLFVMQDVLEPYCITEEQFMFCYTNCWKLIPNPDYKPLSTRPVRSDFASEREYGMAVSKYLESKVGPSKIRVLDESKMTMSVSDYIKRSKFGKWYDENNGRIYLGEMYYQGHLNYLRTLNNIELRKVH